MSKTHKKITVQVTEAGHRVGQSHPRAKLTDAQVALIRELNEEYEIGYRKLAWAFSVPRVTIQHICTYFRRNTPAIQTRVKLVKTCE